MKWSEPQAERRRRGGGQRHEGECCDCEISADLFHDPAPEKTKNERLLTRTRTGEFHGFRHIRRFALPLVAEAQQRNQHKSKGSKRRRNQDERRQCSVESMRVEE